MRSLFFASLVAAGAIAGQLLPPPAPAAAQTLELELGEDGPRIRMREDDRCDPRFERCRPRRGESGRIVERGCSEREAVRKAERMGLDRVRVVDIGRRSIEVRGRDRRGDRVFVAFGRQRGCPILR